MKKIYIDYDGSIIPFKTKENKQEYIITKILQEKYDVIISEEDPDYLFVLGYDFNSEFRHSSDRVIHIHLMTEPANVNFCLFDYTVGFDKVTLGDRYTQANLFLLGVIKTATEKKTQENQQQYIDRKFCSFLYSNTRADKRIEFLKNLSRYKHVDSGGAVCNNMGNTTRLGTEVYKDYKFNIAFENSWYPGYTTEKILNAFNYDTIPIYWGNPNVTEYFDSKAFINCHDYQNFDEVVQRVREVDTNPDLYMEMLQTPALKKEKIGKMRERLLQFLIDIFEQPLDKAKRRYTGAGYQAAAQRIKNPNLDIAHKKLRQRKWAILGLLASNLLTIVATIVLLML